MEIRKLETNQIDAIKKFRKTFMQNTNEICESVMGVANSETMKKRAMELKRRN